MINLLLSFFIVLVFFIVVKETVARILFTLILSLTPFYPLFSTTGNSEIFSSLFVFLSFLSTYYYIIKGKNYHLLLFILFASLASLSNRENFILFIIFGLSYLYFSRRIKAKHLLLFILLSLTGLGLLYILQVFKTEQQYAEDIQNATFSIVYLFDNTVALLKAMFSFKLWGVTGILTVLSLTTFFIFNKKSDILKILAIFLVSYYLVTFLHYRHFYYLQTGKVSPFETLRYTTTFFPLLVAFISINLSTLLKGYKRNIIAIMAIILIPLLLVQTYNTRVNYSQDEEYSRIEPAKEVVSYYKNGDLIIADFPIVIKNIAPEETMVADLRYLSDIKLNSFNNIYLLINKDEKDEGVKNLELKKIGDKNNYEIFKLVR